MSFKEEVIVPMGVVMVILATTAFVVWFSAQGYPPVDASPTGPIGSGVWPVICR